MLKSILLEVLEGMPEGSPYGEDLWNYRDIPFHTDLEFFWGKRGGVKCVS